MKLKTGLMEQKQRTLQHFEQGSVLKEDGRAWFTWSHFYEELKKNTSMGN